MRFTGPVKMDNYPLWQVCTLGLMDKATGFEPVDWEFESLRVRHFISSMTYRPDKPAANTMIQQPVRSQFV